MFSLTSLPTELIRCIIFALDVSSDLLHVALTCKLLYEFIIPTKHLHLTNICCSTSETPLEFWKKLHVSRHFASMIRKLEICDDFYANDRRTRWRMFRFRRQRIGKEFVSAWTGSNPRLPITPAASSRDLIGSLSAMEGLKAISIYKEKPDGEYDELLYHISKNFSHCLKILHVEFGFDRTRSYIPRHALSDLSFYHLTSCSLEFSFNATVPEPFNSILNSLASSCHTLLEFALSLSCQRFPCLQWVKQAHWTSLKKLSFIGFPTLVNAEDLPLAEDIIDLFLSFFARHPKLECLYLGRLRNDINDAVNQFLGQRKERIRDVFPSLRSLHCSVAIPPELLCRLVHVDNLDCTPSEFYPFAQSLRSCDFDLITLDKFRVLVEHNRHLERLSMTLIRPDDHEESERFWDGLPELLMRLENLTHLLLYLDTGREDEDTYCIENWAKYLPSLTHGCVLNNRFCAENWVHITRTVDPNNLKDRLLTPISYHPGQPFDHDHWGDFFKVAT